MQEGSKKPAYYAGGNIFINDQDEENLDFWKKGFCNFDKRIFYYRQKVLKLLIDDEIEQAMEFLDFYVIKYKQLCKWDFGIFEEAEELLLRLCT